MTTLPTTWTSDDTRVRVAGFIREDVFRDLFQKRFPLHGAQGRIVAILINALHQHLTQHKILMVLCIFSLVHQVGK